jgi:hypothetical protein
LSTSSDCSSSNASTSPTIFVHRAGFENREEGKEWNCDEKKM